MIFLEVGWTGVLLVQEKWAHSEGSPTHPSTVGSSDLMLLLKWSLRVAAELT